ncbi:cytochrome c oxidase assembly protein subunit 15 [Tessaracoccus bendigoensis DSM 12906]|uniref:Cytochrome c oxidase assembly protein subunit 15 n=1 Tax=Tessaracoccus bendigoensis DSM 12906 TaxID=1123357 RepID=A0A1M6ID67_9ACTN|nr:COX15/CtaA family protein [Tessaracoccus bendigoensis]SHJ32343.1 cytochrome c oxidase assembly protein subunit 15 [Tessaracoccus bendigoensis DSM 12906]
MDFLRKLVDGEKALRIWLFASLICNMGIVVTGAVVRLTASGLGCSTWPKCTEESYVPHEASGIHGLIEFGNRTLTFVLIIAALGAFIAAWRNRGPRTKLWWITLGIGIGIPFQGVIGGVTVLTQLNPFVVALHLMLSVALIVICVWSLQVASGRPAIMVNARQRTAVIATFAACMLATWIGTVVTGSGPHAGDEDAVRTGFQIEVVAKFHGLSAWLVVALTLVCLFLFRGLPQVRRMMGTLLLVVLAQGAIGYIQYFLGVPALIVAMHMVGLTVLTAVAARPLVTTARSTHVDQSGADASTALHAS